MRPEHPPLHGATSFLEEDGHAATGDDLLSLAALLCGRVPQGASTVGVCSSSPRFVLAGALAAWKTGCRPLLLDPHLMREPKALTAQFPGLPVLMERPHPIWSHGLVVDTTDAQGLPPLVPRWPEADGVAALFLTSGSTGEPKLVEKRGYQLFEQLGSELAWLGVPAGLSVYSLVPPFHILGFVYGLFLPLLAGGRSLHTPAAFPAGQVRAIRRLGPDLVVGVPSQYRALARASREPLPEAFYFSSGAPLSPEVHDSFARSTGRSLVQMYGSTETGGIAKREGFGAWGPFPGLEWRVDGDGRLVVRSPWQEEPGAWRTTDDVVAPLDDGFRLVGRADSIVKVGGKRFSTDAIARAARVIPGVDAAEALPYLRYHEVAVALFVVGDGLTEAALREALAARLAPYEIPRSIHLLDELPTLAAGKVDRRHLLRLATGEHSP